mmetsp:Transcript_857/g.2267  ORF Transcript_857/g.2267 Transcript_857/m.2267 type:complete len:463 (+) Transcript_857:73-1461(+)
MSLAREQRTRTRRRLLPATMLAGAVALVSKPAFLPAPSTRTSVSEMHGQRQAAVAAAAALSTLGATALPAFAADPLAHGTVGTMDMSTFQGIFERGAFGGLLASTVMAWWRATLGGARAAGDEGKPASFWALLFSCISIAVLLSGRWYESGHFPLSNMYESLMFLAWGVTAVTIFFLSSAYGEKENNKLGAKNTAMSDIAAVMASPLSLGIVAFATLKLPKELQKASSLVPALQSDWLVMHVSVVMLAYATLMFGSVLCMAVLALSQPKDSPITALRESVLPFIRGIADGLGSPRLQPAMATSPQVPQGTVAAMTLAPESNVQNASGPAIMSTSGGAITMEFSSSGGAPVQLSDEDSLALTLDDLAYRSLLLGFGFLTVGIVSGAVWANEAWGNYWSWDPKETWALICWLVYAGYLHTRLQLGWDTRDSSKIGAFGFFVVWLCYIGVNLMGVGLHSYGFFLK